MWVNVAIITCQGRDIAGQQFRQSGVPRLTGRHKGLGELALSGGSDRDAVLFREMAFRAMKELATMLRGFSMIPAISVNEYSNASCRRNTAHSDGEKCSSSLSERSGSEPLILCVEPI